jgi:hypothetical protein
MCDLNVGKRAGLGALNKPYTGNNNYVKALRFADFQLKDELNGYTKQVLINNENERKSHVYADACSKMNSNNLAVVTKAKEMFLSIPDWKDSSVLITKCDIQIAKLNKLAEEARKEKIYSDACGYLNSKDIAVVNKAKEMFSSIPDWKDSTEMLKNCDDHIKDLKEAEKLQQRIDASKAKNKYVSNINRKIGAKKRAINEAKSHISTNEGFKKESARNIILMVLGIIIFVGGVVMSITDLVLMSNLNTSEEAIVDSALNNYAILAVVGLFMLPIGAFLELKFNEDYEDEVGKIIWFTILTFITYGIAGIVFTIITIKKIKEEAESVNNSKYEIADNKYKVEKLNREMAALLETLKEAENRTIESFIGQLETIEAESNNLENAD